MARGLVIPANPLEPVRELDIPEDLDGLGLLQRTVGGHIEAIGLPSHVDPDGKATCYINEEGKYMDSCPPNMRATDLFVPGVGLFWGDYIAGDAIIVGFNARTGENVDVPVNVEEKIRKIESEAAA
jgi:hypothetical protein